MGTAFDELYKYFKRKENEITLLSDACKKMIGEATSNGKYNPIYDEMRVKNLGWDTIDLANLAGGVEENRWLTEGEVVSFSKALHDFLGESP